MITARTFERRQIQTAGWLADPANVIYVAEIDDGEVVGFAMGSPPREPASHAELRALYLEKRVQRRGIRSALADAVIADLQLRSNEPIDVAVHARNDAARRFYEAQRARFVDERDVALDDITIPIALYSW